MRHIAESMAKVRQCTPTLATAYNLATVWAPNLFRDAGNDKHSIISLITYGFLNHHRRLFRRLEAGERDDVKPVCRNEWPCNKTISSPSFTPLTKRQFSTEDGGKPSPVWGADHRQSRKNFTQRPIFLCMFRCSNQVGISKKASFFNFINVCQRWIQQRRVHRHSQ